MNIGKQDTIKLSKSMNKSFLDISKSVFEDSNFESDSSEESDQRSDISVNHERDKILKYIIRVNDPRRVNWDLFVMSLATWNCIWIPFEIAFDPAETESIYIRLTDVIIDFFFFLDIILTFRTTYIKGSNGDEVTQPKKIARHYLKNRFIIDLLSIFPFELLMRGKESLEFLNIFGVVKVARVLRLGNIINVLNAREDIKLTLKLCNLVFSLILYIHLAGCLWHYVHTDTKNWIPPLDYMHAQTDLYERGNLYMY